MDTSGAELQGEEERLRQRLTELRQEVGALEARLAEIAREQEPLRRPRSVRAGVRLVADMPANTPEASVRVVPAPAPERPVDYLAVLRSSPRGTALFAPETDETVLLVRSDTRRIAELGPDPEIEFRAGLFEGSTDGPVLVPILVRIGPREPDDLYEAWLGDEAGTAADILRRLAGQGEVVIRLHDDECQPTRLLRAANVLRPFAREAADLIAARRPWSADVFHHARALIYKQNPQVLSLWRALKGARPC
jgi:hypothetical protein